MTKIKDTEELESVLGNTHPREIDSFFEKNKESMIDEEFPFGSYIKGKIKENDMRQQDVFLMADLPQRYGYKLLSGEKKTRQRDVILRICYASKLTLEETQKALKLYKMPELFVKMKRDALLMMAFNKRPGSIIEINVLLSEHGMEPLRTSGVQE